MEASDYASVVCPEMPLDPGIAREVQILREAGVETFESCQGGAGHASPEPMIKLHGTSSAGWRALAICLDHGLDVMDLQRVWDVVDGEPDGPYWKLVFRRRD